jgi:hypothetical protein
MSLKETLTAPSFKRNKAGRTLVYLYGRNGYFVPDAATEAKLRTIRLWLIIAPLLLYIIGMPIMLLSFGQIYEWPFAAWCIAVAVLALLDIGQRAVVRMITRGMAPAGPIGMAEALQRTRETFPRFWSWFLWYLVVAAPIVFVGSVLYLATGTWIVGYVVSIAGVAFSGCMMVGGIYGLRWRSQ